LSKLLIINNLEAWYAAQADVPGMEVHRDPDITWMLSNGTTWANSGVSLRFRSANAGRRIDQILNCYAERGRALGFWIDQEATPTNIEELLKQRGLRCRKRFPGMCCDLAKLPKIAIPKGVRILQTPHHSMYLRHPHPYFGPITTAIRRHELNRLAHLAAQWPKRFFDFVALTTDNRPVGACSMFLDDGVAGFYDVGVLEPERNRGIGSAMMALALRSAREHDATQAVLVATGIGCGMYRRVGFREVCQIAYWYRARKR
jgi:ribosomal protein S18 acetylase RimI-like enzyme